ncbi:uncharacterized protein LOC129906909 [Episyrphus balteatus]|uniref:uncharacterized protein LOC129906909 n=1 Tax=Episyrphus balteatus TaxID=286459 RepID=UPI0024856405|nr:uncharacterized protein LOC129906909 [Episyrphus balteatus]
MYFSEAEYSIFTLDDFAVREANMLNQNVFKPTKKLSELSIGVKYEMFNIEKITTKWGERIVADVGASKVFLPGRYSTLSPSSLIAMSGGGYGFEIIRAIGSMYEIKFVKLK